MISDPKFIASAPSVGVRRLWGARTPHRPLARGRQTAPGHRASRQTAFGRPELTRFLDWVRRKPDDFFERTRKSQRLRSR